MNSRRHAVLRPALRGALVLRDLQRAHPGRNEQNAQHRRELHRRLRSLHSIFHERQINGDEILNRDEDPQQRVDQEVLERQVQHLPSRRAESASELCLRVQTSVQTGSVSW